jgi:CRP/FNR family transcriptional regulator, dissimilatory nitrate respiration regulator
MLDCKPSPDTNIPLLDRLSEDVRACLLAKATLRTYDRGTTICLQGEPTSCLKIIKRGWVKQYRVTPGGDEAVLATLREGRSFDELPALMGGRSPASVEAVKNCTVLHLDLSSICSCCNAYQEINAAVLSAAVSHLDCMMDQVEDLKVKTSAQRLSDFLIDLSNSAGGAIEVDLPYEKVVLAGELGMKPESLSRAFSRLKSLGVHSHKGQIRLNNVGALKEFAEDCRFAH